MSRGSGSRGLNWLMHNSIIFFVLFPANIHNVSDFLPLHSLSDGFSPSIALCGKVWPLYRYSVPGTFFKLNTTYTWSLSFMRVAYNLYMIGDLQLRIYDRRFRGQCFKIWEISDINYSVQHGITIIPQRQYPPVPRLVRSTKPWVTNGETEN